MLKIDSNLEKMFGDIFDVKEYYNISELEAR